MAEAMLECVVCGTRKWRQLELTKAGELASAGAVLLACEGCKRHLLEDVRLRAAVRPGAPGACRAGQPDGI